MSGKQFHLPWQLCEAGYCCYFQDKIQTLFHLWGISGMLLAIPLLAITKLFLDSIEPLKPWGHVLGDTMPAGTEFEPVNDKTRKISRYKRKSQTKSTGLLR